MPTSMSAGLGLRSCRRVSRFEFRGSRSRWQQAHIRSTQAAASRSRLAPSIAKLTRPQARLVTRSSRLIEIGAGLRELGRRPLEVMATSGSDFELGSLLRIRSALSVRSEGSSSWQPTSTTPGRIRGTLSSCGIKKTSNLCVTSATVARQLVRMEVLGMEVNDA